ncbi:MAG: ATP-binding protein [Anaerovoracaceae bacterium]
MHYTNNDKVLVNSGNQDIDSILNYKFEKGKEAGVQISTNISVPSTLSIEPFDIAVILGNTIDNALEAVLNVSERWIHVEIHYSKGRLIIEVINSFDGIVKMKQDRLLTRKHEKENHGLGLHSVELVVAKYDGLLQTTYDDQKFKAKMLIYLP